MDQKKIDAIIAKYPHFKKAFETGIEVSFLKEIDERSEFDACL